MSEYAEKLKDVRWQKKRLKILERDKFTCQGCWESEDSAKFHKVKLTLHVHHCYYERGREPWDYPNESLISLCEECHSAESDCVEAERELIKSMKLRKFLKSDFQSLTRSLNKSEYPENLPAWTLTSAAMYCLEDHWLRYVINSIQIHNDYDGAIEVIQQLKREHLEKKKIEKSLSRYAGIQQSGGIF